MKRGYCGIGIWFPQKEENMGTLFRGAMAFDADFMFTIGRKYSRQSSDTCHSTRHLPYFNFPNQDSFNDCRPSGAQLVCIEITDTAHYLPTFIHPERAVYLLGSEGGGLPKELLEKSVVVRIPTTVCLNVANAGTIVLYDRLLKRAKCE